jgi:hypothetical protein
MPAVPLLYGTISRQSEGSGDLKLPQVNKVHGVVITTREPLAIISLETGVSLKDPSYPTVETKGDLPVGFIGMSTIASMRIHGVGDSGQDNNGHDIGRQASTATEQNVQLAGAG